MATDSVPRQRSRRPDKPRRDETSSVLIIPRQDSLMIRRRQEIREALHDEKAVTIKAKGK